MAKRFDHGINSPESRIERIQRIVSAYRQSGLTQREFVRQHGIGLSTLSRWLAECKKMQQEGTATFVAAPNLFSQSAQAQEGWAYCVQSPKGWRLDLRPGYSLPELQRILRELALL